MYKQRNGMMTRQNRPVVLKNTGTKSGGSKRLSHAHREKISAALKRHHAKKKRR